MYLECSEMVEWHIICDANLNWSDSFWKTKKKIVIKFQQHNSNTRTRRMGTDKNLGCSYDFRKKKHKVRQS